MHAGETVREVMHTLQIDRVCERSTTICTMYHEQHGNIEARREHDVVDVPNAAYVVIQAEHVAANDSDEDNSDDEVSTDMPEDDADSDASSLMSGQPTWITWHNQQSHALPWEDDFEDDVNMDEEDESPFDTDVHIFNRQQFHEWFANARQRLSNNDDILLVTFGLGLTDLGCRSRDVRLEDLEDIWQAALDMWQDHAPYGWTYLHFVNPQPLVAEQRISITIIVEIQYQEIRDWNMCAILVQEEGAEEVMSIPHVYAARVSCRQHAAALVNALQLEQHVLPTSYRGYQITCRDHRWQEGEQQICDNGDLCRIHYEGYPEWVATLDTQVSKGEDLAIQVRREDHRHKAICLRFHGSSPNNQPLGHRDLHLTQQGFEELTWLEEAKQLWPFQSEFVFVVFVEKEDQAFVHDVESKPVYHMIVSYKTQNDGLPVLVRQSIVGLEDGSAHTETWAVDVRNDYDDNNILHELTHNVFWTHKFPEGKISCRMPSPGSRAGAVFEYVLRTHFRFNVVAVLQDNGQHRWHGSQSTDEELEYNSLLQLGPIQYQMEQGFDEICHSILQQAHDIVHDGDSEPSMVQQVDASHDNATGEMSEKGQYESVTDQNASHNTVRQQLDRVDPEDCVTHDALVSLEVAVQSMRHPWQGMNYDFEMLPTVHPMADFALNNTPPCKNLTHRLHVFTDGSADRKQAAWAFCIINEHCSGEHTYFTKVGYAAGLVDDSLGPCESNAQDAEATAIIAAGEFLLANIRHLKCEVFLHFDAVNAGFGACGSQNEPSFHGEPSHRQHAARVVISMLEAEAEGLHACHVKAHQCHPWNEFSDSLAWHARKGWTPEVTACFASIAILQHPLRDFAWMLVRPTANLPHLSQILRNDIPQAGQGWVDSNLTLPSQGSNHSNRIDLVFATANVGTMNYERGQDVTCNAKANEIMNQCRHFDIVCIQESRAKSTQVIQHGHFCRFIAEGQHGQGGIEIWVNVQHFHDKWGESFHFSKDACIWHQSHRILALAIRHPGLQLDVISCYAPQKGRPDHEIRSWWHELTQVIDQRPRSEQHVPLILAGDMNCRLGSICDAHIGDSDADFEDVGGKEFHQTCRQHDLMVVNTFGHLHRGTGWTYTSPLGHRSRVDYVAVSRTIDEGIKESKVHEDIDLMNGDQDHHVVGVHLQVERSSKGQPRLIRRQMYDRDRAREDKRLHTGKIMHDLPAIPWDVDVNVHWSILRDELQQRACKTYPQQKRKQRQQYFSPTCWRLLCQRKELRAIHRQQQRDEDTHLLQTCFQAWSKKCQAATDVHAHHRRLALALTLKMRQDVDKAFKKQKQGDWKTWVKQQLEEKIQVLQHRPNTDLFKLFQPKRQIAKHAGAMRIQLPGLKDVNNGWVTGRHNIAQAWKAQFAVTENAEPASLEEFLKHSHATCKPFQPHDLVNVPTIYDVEKAVRNLADTKAPGADALGAELYQQNVPKAAQAIYPLVLKSAFRRQSIPEHTGGWLLPLHKKKGSVQCMAMYRGILLEPVIARMISKSWRNIYAAGLANEAAPMQWGGRKGVSPTCVHLQVRMWQSDAWAVKKSMSVIYMDIQAAFYSVCKAMLSGFDGSQESLLHTFRLMQLPETAFQEFLENVKKASLVRQATGSQLAEDNIAAMLSQTWYAIPDSSEVMGPRTGSRPGDPIADVLFGMIMSRCLQVINQRLEEQGLANEPFCPEHVQPPNVTWVDDVAFCVHGSPQDLVSRTIHTTAVIFDTMTEHGFSLSLGPGKTAVMFAFHGPGAVRARQACERQHPNSLPIMSEHLGKQEVPVVNHYKHLGGFVVRGASLIPEIQVRNAQVMQRIRPLRPILSAPGIPVAKRRILMKSMLMSVASVNAGAWFNVGLGEFQTWQAMIWHVYRSVNDKSSVETQQNFFQLALRADSPMPMELLHTAKLALCVHVIQHGDEFVIDGILHNHACAQSASWLSSVLKGWLWVQEQIGAEQLPQQVHALETVTTWKELQPHARHLKKCINHAKKAHLSRIQALCAIQEQADFQDQMFQQMGWQRDTPVEIAPAPVRCSECQHECKDPAAMAVHMSKKHGVRIAARRFAPDASCRACQRHFHTRARLILHLHYSSTYCWAATMRKFHPMSDEQASKLDSEDRDLKQASHQRGLKSANVDRQWRWCDTAELTDQLERKDESEGYDHGEPTDAEIAEWQEYGCLPPGKGGRPKTCRALGEAQVKNVMAETNATENMLCQRAATWQVPEQSVPRPLSHGTKYVLVLFSGHRRDGDIACWVNHLGRGDVQAVSVDLALHEHYGNIFNFGMWYNLIRSRRVIAAHAGPPCESYSLARWIPVPDSIFPRPLRNTQHPWGMPERNLRETQQCTVGTCLMMIALRLLIAVYVWGGAFSLEHPRGPEQEGGAQWCIWHAGLIKEILRACDTELISFLQGPMGQRFPKPTRLLVARMPWMKRNLFREYNPFWRATESLGGRCAATGAWNTAKAKIYPTALCRALATSYVMYGRQAHLEGSEDPPAEFPQALAALNCWDPYLQESAQTTMQADYHPEKVV